VGPGTFTFGNLRRIGGAAAGAGEDPADAAARRAAGGARIPAGLERRARARMLCLLLPSLVVAVSTALISGRLDAAALLGVATLIAGRLFRHFPYPLTLLPASRATLAATAPVIAALAIVGVSQLSSDHALIEGSQALWIATAGAVSAILAEVVAAAWLARNPLRVAVLGSPDFAVGLQRELSENAVSGIDFVGWLTSGGELLDRGEKGTVAVAELRHAILEHRIDLVVKGRSSGLAGAAFGGSRPFEYAAEVCVDLPVRMLDGAQFYEQSFGHVPLGMIDSAWYLFLMHPSYRSTGSTAKRALDLVGASLASLVALPLIAIAAVAIKLTDGGPILYRQVRIGENGEEFEIVKLRTMSIDAERNGAQWATANDNRITTVGKILRRTHIDELTQVLNVLRGDMTLVGPRPERPEMVAELEQMFPHYRRRLLVKPGVTGWAQVRCGYAGTELGTAWKLCHDLYYLKHRSLVSDLMIMLETLVIAAKDAHRPLRAPSREFVVRAIELEHSEPGQLGSLQRTA
jgi:exopolysaccharide biosynthesis polyprenyl glycosylphosphotransferase